MNNNDNSTEIKRGRGRPSLSPEEKETRRKELTKKSNDYHKSTGYAAKKKYKETYPDRIIESDKTFRESHDNLRIFLHKDFRANLNKIISESNMTITKLFLTAVEEKYGIALTKD